MSSAQLHSNPKLSQKGQGILEVIVTIGIGTIMIMALVVLSIRTNRSSDFSKASSQASNLASEGIEIITNLKEINGTDPNPPYNQLFRLDTGNCLTSSNTYTTWDGVFSIGNNIDDADASCTANLGKLGYIRPDCNATVYSCLTFNSSDSTATNTETITVNNRAFTRRVYIADTPIASGGQSNCNSTATPNDWQTMKQFAVVVSWTDSSGIHNQTQTACLQR